MAQSMDLGGMWSKEGIPYIDKVQTIYYPHITLLFVSMSLIVGNIFPSIKSTYSTKVKYVCLKMQAFNAKLCMNVTIVLVQVIQG